MFHYQCIQNLKRNENVSTRRDCLWRSPEVHGGSGKRGPGIHLVYSTSILKGKLGMVRINCRWVCYLSYCRLKGNLGMHNSYKTGLLNWLRCAVGGTFLAERF